MLAKKVDIAPLGLSLLIFITSLATKDPIKKYDKALTPMKLVNKKSSTRPIIKAPKPPIL